MSAAPAPPGDASGPRSATGMRLPAWWEPLAGRAAIRTVDKALEVAGGPGFYRALGLERLFRDVQGARYHPLQEKPQALFTGRFALGLDVNG